MNICLVGYLVALVSGQITGPTGITGASGASPSGNPGAIGSPGAVGTQGLVGNSGASGQKGMTGPTGNNGAIGYSPPGATGAAGKNPDLNSAIYTTFADCSSPSIPRGAQFLCSPWTQYSFYVTNKTFVPGTTINKNSSTIVMLTIGVINVTLQKVISIPTALKFEIAFPIIRPPQAATFLTSTSAVTATDFSTIYTVSPYYALEQVMPGFIYLTTTISKWSPVNSSLQFAYMITFVSTVAQVPS